MKFRTHCGVKEPRRRVFCELAYTGTLFWLPLLICPQEKYARYHANQGLWLLILSVVGCTAIRLLSALNRFLAGGAFGRGVRRTLFSALPGIPFWDAVSPVERCEQGDGHPPGGDTPADPVL